MALTDEEVLSDSGELVTGFVMGLAEQDLTQENYRIALIDFRKILLGAVEIIDTMLKASRNKIVH